ncbi:MAG: shikimate dehydrogenase [Peptococcaceae bacterium]|nr:shikimate dehydrogenase [Peptococcaceae bacterium]
MPDVKNKSGIDAKTALFGLLGNPVGHSMSPFMQNQFLEQCGVNGVYLAFAVEKDAIGDAIRGMHAMGVQGANVTIPHKEAVIPHLCGMSKAAQACGAVNTLVYTPEGYYGDNTDGSGLLAALAAKNGWKAAGQKILMIGAGGAAKGVAVAMALEGAAEICIANRTVEKAQQLAEQIAALSDTRTAAISMESLQNPDLYKEYSTIVNTTSLGMSPNVDDMAPVCIEALNEQHLVVDLIYNPMETKLLRLAKAQGAKTASGLGMFVYQGVLAFEKWTGKTPEHIDDIESQLIERLTK